MKSKLNIFHGRDFPHKDIDVKMFVSIRLHYGLVMGPSLMRHQIVQVFSLKILFTYRSLIISYDSAAMAVPIKLASLILENSISIFGKPKLLRSVSSVVFVRFR